MLGGDDRRCRCAAVCPAAYIAASAAHPANASRPPIPDVLDPHVTSCLCPPAITVVTVSYHLIVTDLVTVSYDALLVATLFLERSLMMNLACISYSVG